MTTAEVQRSIVDIVPAGPAPKLARFVTEQRLLLAHAFFDCLMDVGSKRFLPPDGAALSDEWLDRTLGSLVDLYARHLGSADPAYLTLFTSDLRWTFRDLPVAPEERSVRRRTAAEAIRHAFLDLARPRLGVNDLGRLQESLDVVVQQLTQEARKRIDILFVGDCVTHDIMGFLDGAALADDIAIEHVLAGSSNGAELRNQLRAQAQSGKKYDLVFYSPFTYDASLELRSVYEVGGSFVGERKLTEMADSAVEAIRPTLQLMAPLHEGPVFVHNASMVQRFEPTLKGRMKARATLGTRERLSTFIRARMAKLLEELRAAGAKNLHLLDETAFVAVHGHERLGAFYHTTETHHPAVFGKVAAERYRDIVFAQARLATKKVVICDLDNTLWDGLVGEGAIVPFLDRQKVLRRLRERGVLLAVNSKNDPAKVTYAGCLLRKEDFVWEEINWERKVANMRRIQEGLNLKTKDFVFIDDRADERELMRRAFPEMEVLDATEPRSWRLLSQWADLLPAAPDLDRTRMYKDRERREAFVSSQKTAVEDDGELFRQLGIKAELRRARPGELPRVTELINRTNQFNLTGARTSLNEVQHWNASYDHVILTAHVADKFGDSGLVCVCVAELGSGTAKILAFVLSCRVFGYGVEHAVLNHLKSHRAAAASLGPLKVEGQLVVTQHNQPCHRFYPDAGFTLVGDTWVCDGQEGRPTPSWLAVIAEATSR